jgi:hypothetical protein
MFKLWTASRRNPKKAEPRRARLAVEALEERYCPAAPQITDFHVFYGSGTTVTLTGTVVDEQPSTVLVSFSGKVIGSTWASTSGTFSYTGQASRLGQVYATALDEEDLYSNTAQLTLTSNAPVIQNFQGSSGPDDLWTFTGTVVDESPGGLTVRFGGLLSGHSVTVWSNGTFMYTAQVTGPGSVTAKTTDWWGLNSNEAWEMI